MDNNQLTDNVLAYVLAVVEDRYNNRKSNAGEDDRIIIALRELQERRKADETRNTDDGLNGQLSRLATHSAEESAQMAEWDRPTPKSDLRMQAEKIADDVQELIKRLPDADQGGA